MKSDYIFSFYALLLIFSLPLLVASVKCPYGRIDEITAGKEKGEIECPASSPSCAAYICNGTKFDENGTDTGKMYAQAIGCIDDFLRDCHIFDAELAIIKAMPSINEMEYHSDHITYVSGCGKDANTKECILTKLKNYQTKTAKSATTTDPNASNGPNGSILKKIGCFIIGLILAVWIY